MHRKTRQVERVMKIVSAQAGPGGLSFCDLTGDAGHYTFAAASRFRWVLHCDLSLDALAYASRKASTLGIENILFLRVDYFRPPFRASIDRMICMDTLIRGPAHEVRVLRAMKESLAPGGEALVDFHNWWHNPFRRLGLLPDNFTGNASYTSTSSLLLLERAGIDRCRYFGFHQEFREGSVRGKLVPPTRLMYLFPASPAA
jgi:SAM-dependent methyltransferase